MATSIETFKVGSQYSFSVYPSNILGSDFNNLICLGIVEANIAKNFTDIVAQHAQVYPYLPAGIENNPYGYQYVMFKTSMGTVIVLGATWISMDTVKMIESGTIKAIISNVESTDLAEISAILRQNGYMLFTLEFNGSETTASTSSN